MKMLKHISDSFAKSIRIHFDKIKSMHKRLLVLLCVGVTGSIVIKIGWDSRWWRYFNARGFNIGHFFLQHFIRMLLVHTQEMIGLYMHTVIPRTNIHFTQAKHSITGLQAQHNATKHDCARPSPQLTERAFSLVNADT